MRQQGAIVGAAHPGGDPLRLATHHFPLQRLEAARRADPHQSTGVEERLSHVEKGRPVVVGAEAHRHQLVRRGGRIEDDLGQERLLHLDVALVAHGGVDTRKQAAPRLPHLLARRRQAQLGVAEIAIVLQRDSDRLAQRVSGAVQALGFNRSR